MAGKGAHLGWMKKGEGFVEWKQYKQAIAAFDRAIKAKGNYAEAWRAKGMTLMEMSEYDKAVKCFEKLIKLEPDKSDGWVTKATALEEKGDTDAAYQCFHQAIAQFPEDLSLFFFFGVYLNRQNQFHEAVAILNKVVEMTPDPLVLTARSQALEQTGQLEAALSDLDRIAIYGEFYMVSQSRGEILEKLERYDEALDAYTAAVQDEPTAPFLWLKKGVLLEQLERNEEALAWYELSITAVGTEGLLMKAQFLAQLQRHEEALAVFQQASELDPDNASIYYDQAVCLIQQGKTAESLTALQAAIARQPADIRTLLAADPAFKPQLNQPEFQALFD
ncbi:tetratricopeptide repeat protein [filamentous cyanobacterium LEGE 11480]|uniref:Tetratricopeptide repeat protein n=1 Tax=Romeriopsis navalis LEGE 11480 TaxID=2777977 RepID=A0A928VHE1_9CYAN|nr:tetratricopeptide repeat protein [Romeriopsis navalis]MBE9028656.1 tetratricopeptide repeat protein [Romeriopsis navalis LEGE 11480]